MTLIAVYTHDGDGGSRCIGRCDAKCYTATEPACDCICGGANHGAGLASAIENTRQQTEAWVEKYAGERGVVEYRTELGQAVEQLGLFE
jgi:hypothetical protein